MKHWQETAAILDRVAELTSAGRSAAVATVVSIRGSAYRRPGARFLIEDDGRTQGGVSGGCLEADVRENAVQVMRTGVARLLHYETGSDDRNVWGLGLGCNGSVDVFVQPVTTSPARQTFSAVRQLLAGDEQIAVCTVVEGKDVGQSLVLTAGGITAGTIGDREEDVRLSKRMRDGALASSALERIGSRLVFTNVLDPPPHLIVCGASDDARPLAACATDAGFRVTVVDHRPAYLTRERFARARLVQMRPDDYGGVFALGSRDSAVLMTHSLALDREWMRRLLATGIGYVGLLGPAGRTEEIFRQIGAEPDDRVFGPVGLDVGADGPEQIAISIVAELLAVRAAREPRHLRARGVPIHA